MERLGDILNRTGTPSPQMLNEAKLKLPPSEHKPAPTCSICKGAEWVTHRVPVGHPEFGQAFRCRCVQTLDAWKRAVRLDAAAGLPKSNPPKTFDNFKLSKGTELALVTARTYAENLHDRPILTLTGVPGCGKSHLLEAIGRRVLERGIGVRYTVGASLLDELRAAYDPDSEDAFQRVFDRYNQADLLILDDPGAEAATPWAIEKLYTLVNNRCKDRRPLAVATNLDFRTMRNRLGPRTTDRLWDTNSGLVTVLVITADSYRTGALH